MAASPWTLYQSLLARTQGASEAEACARIRQALRSPRASWPACLRQVVDAAAVSPGYLTRHVLSIRGFAPDVRRALEAGLPLAVCRLVNGLPDEDLRAEALAPLWGALQGRHAGALLPRGVAAQVERHARRLRLHQGKTPPDQHDVNVTTGSGWLLPASAPSTPVCPAGDVWFYPAQPRASRLAEAFPPSMAEGLIATYLAPGDRLVDVTAGTGTFGSVSRRLGVASWSGDIAPGAAFVHPADARTLLLPGADGAVPPPEPSTAAALVLHPPTFPAWRDGLPAPTRKLATLDQYAEDVAAMIGGSLGALVPRGVLILITRPERGGGQVSLVTSHLAQLLNEFDLELVGYHLAVSEDGHDDWHALVGRARASDGTG